MSTFADILANVPPPSTLSKDMPLVRIRESVSRGVSKIPVIVITDVAKYFFNVVGLGHEPPEDKDFPNVAPPFPEFWMEYRVPATLMFGEPRQPVPADFGGQRVGFFWYAEDRPDGSPGWCLTSLAFLEHDGWAVGPMASVRLQSDVNGQLVDFSTTTLVSDAAGSAAEAQEDSILHSWMAFLHDPAALAICFMHCKNVKLVNHEVKPNHLRRHLKIYGRAPIVYKTLDITPMQKVIVSEGGTSCGLKTALHIMRGHFKSFDEKPLFGKHKGMWWWSSHVRGSLERGYVKKAYEVHPPKKDEPER